MSASQPLSRTVERVIHADAGAIFDLLADPFRHHLFDGSGMVQGRPHGPGRLSQGARFTMAQKMGPLPYRSDCEVVEFEEGRRIAWASYTAVRGRRVAGGQVWRYELEPREDGTLVRETHDLTRASKPVAALMSRTPGGERFAAGMTESLARLAKLVEKA